VVLGVMLIAAVMALLLPEAEDEESSDAGERQVKGGFSFILPVGWNWKRDGLVYLFKERGKTRVILLERQHADVRRWTYKTCFDELLPKLLKYKSAPDTGIEHWQLDGGGASPSTHLLRSGWEIPYACYRAGEADNTVKGRLYLNDDDAICLLYWDHGAKRSEVEEFLEEFRMEGGNQYIDRRQFEVSFASGELRDRLEAAISLFNEYGSSPKNGWGAYENLLLIRSWISRDATSVDPEIDRESWALLVEVAERLQTDFMAKYCAVVRGQLDGRAVLQDLQETIPEFDLRHTEVKNKLRDLQNR